MRDRTPWSRHDHQASLPVGSTLLLYTDGLFERRGSDLDHDLEGCAPRWRRWADRDLETFCGELIDRTATTVTTRNLLSAPAGVGGCRP
jgi:hypothetical protein